MHLNILLNVLAYLLELFFINQTIIVGLCMLLFFFLNHKALKNKHKHHFDLLAAGLWYTTAFVFVGCSYNDWPAVSVPYIPLDNVSVCVSLVVSSGLQSSKGSVFPVTVLWQKHLHTVTRSDQPKQLSAGKSYRENVYAFPEHISQNPATWIKPAAKFSFFLFQAYKVLPDLNLYGPKQSIEFCEMLICEYQVVL